MNILENLIQDYCPNGVHYEKIKDTYQRLKGTPITAAKMKEIANENGDIRIFAGGKTVINANEKDIPNANITRVPAVLVQSRGVIDVVYYDKPFTFKNEMWAYTSSDEISVKFLYYVLKNNIEYFREAASGMGSLPQISLPVTEEFKISVPPLPVQAEIVRILDNFTELTAELTARKKQYEYYRDEMLNFGNDVDYKTIEEIFDVRNGYTPSKNNQEFWDNGTIPWFRIEDIRQQGRILNDAIHHISAKAVKGGRLFPSGSIIVSTTATIGEHALINIDALTNQQMTCLTLKTEYKEKLDNKFVFFYCYVLGEWCRKNVNNGGNLPIIGIEKIKKFRFPVPPLEEQKRIVSILDRFDKLCNDISEGLPAEIAARQKQYEYYRDKLLTFKER